jgi:hypothetical protein
MNVNALSYFFPNNSTANNVNSASSVQQQADVLGLSPNDQFLAQLQQVQSPQQFQAMISQMSGQPQQADTPATSGTQPPLSRRPSRFKLPFHRAERCPGAGRPLKAEQQREVVRTGRVELPFPFGSQILSLFNGLRVGTDRS